MKKKSKKPENNGKNDFFERFASRVAIATGSSGAFLIALSFVIVWASTGPIFHYSESWQMVINTGTTIVTFLMVFLIQKVQNKDSTAIQLKLDELVASHHTASNRLVNVEELSEKELIALKEHYGRMAEASKNEINDRQSHSVDEEDEKKGAKRKAT